MSADPEFQNLLDTLLKSPDVNARAQAAKLLGDYVDELNDEEYAEARSALDQALSDPDPMVLMNAMGALTRYNRQGAGEDADYAVEGDSEADMIGGLERAVCSICGRPEALIPDGGCDRDDCPYR